MVANLGSEEQPWTTIRPSQAKRVVLADVPGGRERVVFFLVQRDALSAREMFWPTWGLLGAAGEMGTYGAAGATVTYGAAGATVT